MRQGDAALPGAGTESETACRDDGRTLPAAETEEEFEGVRLDEGRLRPGVDRLCSELGVDPGVLSRFPSGSMPVYAAGDAVLKLYPGLHRAARAVEVGVLAAVDGRLPVATPSVRATGNWDGWGYVLMSLVPGVPLDTVWDSLDAEDRDRLAREIGELIAAMHRVPPPELAGWAGDWDWAGFVERQRSGCAAEQVSFGLAREWAEQIPGFLESVALRHEPRVLLHTEIMRQHLMVLPDPWRLAGLVDFEPAMPGASEYEFAAVGTFVSNGDARFLRRILLGYGYGAGDLDAALRRRMLAWALLHRYCYLAGWLRRLPAPRAPTLEALADTWFGC